MRRSGILQFALPVSLLISTLFVAAAPAQDDRPAHPPTSTIYGNTGLWKVLGATNLPQYQTSFSVWYDRVNRNPGYLTISTIGISGALGITDWLEFGMNFEINKRILARRQDQLSFGQQALGFFGNRTPFAAPAPPQLASGSQIMPMLRFPQTPTGTFNGTTGYYNNLPWAGRRLQGNGVGPVTFGVKLNPFAEERGSPLGLSFRGFGVIPTHRSPDFLLHRPTQTGDWIIGSDIILSKYVGDMAEVHFNTGFHGYQSPDDGRFMVLSDIVPLGLGFTIPRKTRLQVMAEVNATIFVGAHTRVTTFDARDPVDGTIGFRAWLTPWLALSGGYRHPFNQFGGDKNGFIADLTFSTAKEEKAPPQPISLTCSADPSQVDAGQTVNLSAQAVVPGGGVATYEWTTTGGTIEGSGATVRLRTDGLAPGTYTATVRASNGPNTVPADCSATVTVRTPPPPPQPPTVSLSADKDRPQIGEIVNFTADARSPDNRPLTYEWTSTAGRIEGTGARTRLDTTGMRAGAVTATVKVTDDRGLSASDSVTVTLVAPPPPPPPPPPQPSKLNDCGFRLNSARVDNVCKAKLDDVALRLRNEPDATLTIVGYADTRERNANRLADTRANNTKTYLVRDKGIADSRVQVRRGPAARGVENRRVDIYLVPRGATLNIGAASNTPAAGRSISNAAIPSADTNLPIHTGDRGGASASPPQAPASDGKQQGGARRVIIGSTL